MFQESIESELLGAVAQRYEHDPAQFMTVPRQTADSSAAPGCGSAAPLEPRTGR